MGRCPLAQLLAVPAARQRIQRGPGPLLVAAGPGGPRPGDQTPGRLFQGQAADQAFLLCAQEPAAAAQLAQGHLGFSLGFAEGDAAGFPPPKDLAVGHALGEVVEGDAAMAQSSWIDRPLKRATGKPRTEFQASWHGGAAGVYGRRTRQQRISTEISAIAPERPDQRVTSSSSVTSGMAREGQQRPRHLSVGILQAAAVFATLTANAGAPAPWPSHNAHTVIER